MGTALDGDFPGVLTHWVGMLIIFGSRDSRGWFLLPSHPSMSSDGVHVEISEIWVLFSLLLFRAQV
jgi:hypothetical protein